MLGDLGHARVNALVTKSVEYGERKCSSFSLRDNQIFLNKSHDGWSASCKHFIEKPTEGLASAEVVAIVIFVGCLDQ